MKPRHLNLDVLFTPWGFPLFLYALFAVGWPIPASSNWWSLYHNEITQPHSNLTALLKGSAPNHQWVNYSIIHKSATDPERVELALNNCGGEVRVEEGILVLKGAQGHSLLHSNGIFTVHRGAILDLGGGTINVLNGRYKGDGEGFIELNQGSLRTGEDGLKTIFDFKNGGFRWKGGTLETMKAKLVNRGRMSLEGDSAKNLATGPGIENRGYVTHSGSGSLNLEHGTTWINGIKGRHEWKTHAPITAIGGLGAPPLFLNIGTLEKNGGRVSLIETLFLNRGVLSVSTGILYFKEGLLQESGVTRLAGGHVRAAGAVEIDGGRFEGVGDVQAVVINRGTLAPGDSIGQLRIFNNYHQSASGSLEIEMCADGYDQVRIDGNIFMDGTLTVTALNEYTPAPGDEFKILHGKSCRGVFMKVNWPSLPPGLTWHIDYRDDGVILKVEG